jgi:hypothetical protein
VVEIKTAGEVQAMRAAGQVVAQILAATRAEAKAGMALTELDEIARGVLAEAGATSPFLGYQPGFAPIPFPGVICASVNDAALHGIPGRYRLADGDLLSVDCGAVLDGWTGDAAISFTIGPPDPARAADRHRRRSPAGRHCRRGPGRADRRHIGGHRRGRPRGRLRDLHRFWRSWRWPGDARGSSHPERGTAWPRSPARARAGPRDRAVVPGRRPGQLRDRPGRLDDPQRRRQPSGSRRAHRGDHRRWPADLDATLTCRSAYR